MSGADDGGDAVEAARPVHAVLGQHAVQLVDAAAQSHDLRAKSLVLGADLRDLFAHRPLPLQSILAASARRAAVLRPLVGVVGIH